ncbi:MAG: hypothetical protein AB1Z98_28915 [Nannocystaceae bacterium]
MMLCAHNPLVYALGLALVMHGLAPSAARAQAPTHDESAPRVRASLVIETDELGEGGPSMAEMIGLLEDRVLRERGVGPAEAGTTTQIVVEIRPLEDATGILDNRVDISLEHEGETIADPSWSFDCPQCTDGYLLNKVAVTLHSVVTRLEAETADASPTPGPRDGGGADPGPNDVAPSPKPGPLVWAGTGVGVGGLVIAGVGLGIALRDDRIEGWLANQRVERVETRTPGWTMVGVGAAALVTGGALLAVGLRRHRRAKAAAVVATPWVSPTSAGVGLAARF